MLPKIEDAGQRAGLLDQFAPKIEDQMESLEKKIQDEEKTENEEKTKVTPISVVSKTKDAPAQQSLSKPVPEARKRPGKEQSTPAVKSNRLHQSSAKSKKQKPDEEKEEEVEKKIERTKIEEEKSEGAEDSDEDETIIFSSKKADKRSTAQSGSEAVANEKVTSGGSSSKTPSADETISSSESASNANPIESSIEEALKQKKEEMHPVKKTNFVEESISQVMKIRELEAKIARLEESQKSS